MIKAIFGALSTALEKSGNGMSVEANITKCENYVNVDNKTPEQKNTGTGEK